MGDGSLTESTVEDAALAWLEGVGWNMKHGPEIARGEVFAEREDHGEVVLAQRLRDALARLNPALPAAAGAPVALLRTLSNNTQRDE